MFRRLSKVLRARIKDYSFEKEISAARVCSLWTKKSAGFLGIKISDETRVLYFKKGVLYIKVSSPVISQELQFQKREIVKQLNNLLREDIVKDVVFKAYSYVN